MKNKIPTLLELPKKLLDAASTDKTRVVINSAFIDGAKRMIVCTTGRIMTNMPIPGDAPLTDWFISPTLWKMAKAKNPKGFFLDAEKGELNGLALDKPEDVGNYPNWQAVIPIFTPVYRFVLNPALLAQIAASFGHDGDQGLTLEFDSDHRSPARIKMHDKNGEKTGVIMPMIGAGDSGLLIATDADAEKLRKEVASLRKALDAKVSECSDKPITTAADSGEIDALRAALFEQRARVTSLEAQLAAKPTATGNATPKNPKKPKEKTPVPDATDRPSLSRNDEKEGIELRFNGKPDDSTRLSMKANGFRWLPGQPGQPWAAKYTEERWLFAQHLATGSAYTPMPEDPAPSPTQPSPEPESPGAKKVNNLLSDF